MLCLVNIIKRKMAILIDGLCISSDKGNLLYWTSRILNMQIVDRCSWYKFASVWNHTCTLVLHCLLLNWIKLVAFVYEILNILWQYWICYMGKCCSFKQTAATVALYVLVFSILNFAYLIYIYIYYFFMFC